jgi:hypothetical protein
MMHPLIHRGMIEEGVVLHLAPPVQQAQRQRREKDDA